MSKIARPERVVWGLWGLVMMVGVVLLFCGCGPPPPTPTVDDLPREASPYHVRAMGSVGGDTLWIVDLPDGNRCAIVDGYESVAIDCWGKP